MLKVELLRRPEIVNPEVAVDEDALWGHHYVFLKVVYLMDIGMFGEVVPEVGLDQQFHTSRKLSALKEPLFLLGDIWSPIVALGLFHRRK